MVMKSEMEDVPSAFLRILSSLLFNFGCSPASLSPSSYYYGLPGLTASSTLSAMLSFSLVSSFCHSGTRALHPSISAQTTPRTRQVDAVRAANGAVVTTGNIMLVIHVHNNIHRLRLSCRPQAIVQMRCYNYGYKCSHANHMSTSPVCRVPCT